MSLRFRFHNRMRILIIAKILLTNPRILMPRQSHLHQLAIPKLEPFAPIQNMAEFLRIAPRRSESVERFDGSCVRRDDEVDGFIWRELFSQGLASHTSHLPPEFGKPHSIVRLGRIQNFIDIPLRLTMSYQDEFGRKTCRIRRQRVLTTELLLQIISHREGDVIVVLLLLLLLLFQSRISLRAFFGEGFRPEMFVLLFFFVVDCFFYMIILFGNGASFGRIKGWCVLVEFFEVTPIAIFVTEVQ
mmetsp:Transcript_4063/g.7855  ORF Transcript_4063/g.7855 Transcript_4063/m.7855 type:complete len:244 (+) Transcript_4063:396-1127(+)